MKNERKWKLIAEEKDQYETRRTARLRVPGGYLYRYEIDTPHGEDARQTTVAMAYVPQPPGRERLAKRV